MQRKSTASERTRLCSAVTRKLLFLVIAAGQRRAAYALAVRRERLPATIAAVVDPIRPNRISFGKKYLWKEGTSTGAPGGRCVAAVPQVREEPTRGRSRQSEGVSWADGLFSAPRTRHTRRCCRRLVDRGCTYCVRIRLQRCFRTVRISSSALAEPRGQRRSSRPAMSCDTARSMCL